MNKIITTVQVVSQAFCNSVIPSDKYSEGAKANPKFVMNVTSHMVQPVLMHQTNQIRQTIQSPNSNHENKPMLSELVYDYLHIAIK